MGLNQSRSKAWDLYREEVLKNKENSIITHQGISEKVAHITERQKRQKEDAIGYSTASSEFFIDVEIEGLDKAKGLDELLKGMFKMNVDKLECRNWEFTVANKSAICIEEVTKYIDRENPVAVMVHDSYAVCFVHTSIMDKALAIDNDIPWKFKKVGTRYYLAAVDKDEFQIVIKWARYIKSAEWLHKFEETVRVIIPKI